MQAEKQRKTLLAFADLKATVGGEIADRSCHVCGSLPYNLNRRPWRASSKLCARYLVGRWKTRAIGGGRFAGSDPASRALQKS